MGRVSRDAGPTIAGVSERERAPGPTGEQESGLVPGGLPSRGAYVLAFLSVVLAGVLGAVIGYGLGDLSVDGGSTAAGLAGMVIGGAVAAVGVGVVAVLVLRAMAEWQRGGKRAR
jgi:hypothetical protein